MSDLLGKSILKEYSGEQENSVLACVKRGSSMRISNQVTLSANNTTQTLNLFSFTGTICIDAIFAEVTQKTTLTNCTALQLKAYDGTNTVNLTSNGAVLSGAGVGSFLIKDQEAAQDLNVLLNDQVRFIELTGKKPHQPFLLTGKIGVTNYLQLTYATTDAPINAKLTFYVCYHNINGGTITEV